MSNNTKKKVIFFAVIVVIFILVAVLFLFDFLKNSKINNINKGRVIASVDGFIVYENDLDDRLNIISPDAKVKLEDLPENVLNAMIMEVVVNHKIDLEAEKLKYQKDSEIEEAVENYKKGLIREKYLNDKVYSNITDQDVLDEYNKLVDTLKNKEERKIKHILVENEDEIERVRRNVLRTGNFEKVAKEKSIDTASGENGGDIGYVLKDELVPEFADMAFILKVGEISKPVKTQYGWHIIKVEDVRPAQFLSFEEVKDSIKQKLQQDAIQDYLLSLTKDLKIDLKIDLGQSNDNDLFVEERDNLLEEKNDSSEGVSNKSESDEVSQGNVIIEE